MRLDIGGAEIRRPISGLADRFEPRSPVSNGSRGKVQHMSSAARVINNRENRISDERSLTPVSMVSLPDQVAQRLLEYIAANGLALGDPLPPQRALAERLGVSRPVLRAALHRLEAQGVVAVRHGSGTRVIGRVEVAPVSSLLDGFSHTSAIAILEARMVIDVELAALAAERADAADRQQLEQALERINAAVAAGKPTVSFTSNFHQRIALAARSPVLLEFYERLRLPMLANGRRIEHSLPDVTHGEYENHRELYDALLTRDADIARQAMRQHLRKAHQWEDLVARLRGEVAERLSKTSTGRDD